MFFFFFLKKSPTSTRDFFVYTVHTRSPFFALEKASLASAGLLKERPWEVVALPRGRLRPTQPEWIMQQPLPWKANVSGG